MPVAQRQVETTLLLEEGDPFVSKDKLDQKVFDEIIEYVETIEDCQRSIDMYERKLEKIKSKREMAAESITKANDKYEHVHRILETTKKCFENQEERKAQAEKYWHDFGFEAREVPGQSDEYEFIYRSLSKDSHHLEYPYKVILRLSNRKPLIKSLSPENILTPDQLAELNSELTKVDSSGQINWKETMVLIRKALYKKCQDPKEN